VRSRSARLLVRLYPRAWRERYGDEFLALIGDGGFGWRQAWNVVRAAAEERTILVVRRLLGPEKEDAVIRKIARLVVQCVLAWFGAGAVNAVFPVAATAGGALLRICGWSAVARQAAFIEPPYAWFLSYFLIPVFLSTVFAAPVVIALKVTRAGRAMPMLARVATLAAILLVGLLWQACWAMAAGWWLSLLRMCLSLAAGGSVIACGLFPRSANGHPPGRRAPVDHLT
jgi:hypothetical protein